MKWWRLKINRCPQCNALLKVTLNCKCGFSISEKKMKEIVARLNLQDLNRTYRSESYNQDQLNNL